MIFSHYSVKRSYQKFSFQNIGLDILRAGGGKKKGPPDTITARVDIPYSYSTGIQYLVYGIDAVS